MQHAFAYGVICALSFIGFISIIYYVLLFVYRSKGRCSCVVRIPSGAKPSEIESMIYGSYFRKMIFGDLIYDRIYIDYNELSEEESELVKNILEKIKYCLNLEDDIFLNCEDYDERRI